MVTPRDHGGNLEAARAQFGAGDWIDLSTGINRRPYPVPDLRPEVWTALPTAEARATLIAAAARAYGTAPDTLLPVAGAQAAIQLYPRLRPPGEARVLTPTYNEHAAALRAQGWRVHEVTTLAELAGADLAVVVNPNNPDGQRHDPAALRAVSQNCGLLVVDESFADPYPELSLAPQVTDRLMVLRSFGKFYGLAGVRLGFLVAAPSQVAAMAELAGPWAVSGPALAVGAQALVDTEWAAQTTARLIKDAARLDALAANAGWSLIGGCVLFRTYAMPAATPDATHAQQALARHHIWSRTFPYAPRWLRLGLPDGADWARIERALP